MAGDKIESSQASLPKIPGRVHEHLARIRGEDNKISSVAEAREMLEYLPRATVVFTDDPNAIPFAYMEAEDYLKEHEKKTKEKPISESNNIFDPLNNIYKGYKQVRKTINNINRLVKTLPSIFPISN